MSESKCATCPMLDRPEPCWSFGRPRVCELAGPLGREDYRRLVVEYSLDPPADRDPRDVAARGIEARETIARRKAAKTCTHRVDPRCGCASVPATCTHPERPDRATIDECLECPYVPRP